ncbi:hypothetical protein RB195_022769 [Necator americanus]
MESLATTICFVTLNYRTLSSELQQAALSRLLRYLCVPFAALQETRMRDRPVISIENYTIYCGDADENKMRLSTTADRRGRKLWIVIAHAPTGTAEENSKDVFYDELNSLMSKIPSQQLDYVLARNIPQSDIRKSRAVLDVAFYSDHRPVLLSFKIRFHKRNRGVPLQPKIDMAGLKDDESRTKFRQRVSIHVGVRTRKKLSDADSFTKNIQDAARETLPVLLPRKKFAFASAETKSTYNSVCVACNAGDFNQEKRLRRKLHRQLQQDRNNEWTSRAMEFEKVWKDRNPRKAYALLKQYSSKMKRCSPVLNTASGVAIGEATLPIWREHFKTLLNWLAPSAPELEHVHRPTYAVNEEPPT